MTWIIFNELTFYLYHRTGKTGDSFIFVEEGNKGVNRGKKQNPIRLPCAGPNTTEM